MISRGHYIGEILDMMALVSKQIEFRCAHGLTDLNIYIEDYYRKILNIALGVNMENLNATRSNEPGLDIGDKTAKIAFQVTSNKTSAKINNTLEKIKDNDLQTVFTCIRILIVGEKQGSYTGVDETLCKELSFNISNIWDITDVLKLVVTLETRQVKEIHDYIKEEAIRLEEELKIRSKDEATQPTMVEKSIEPFPTLKLGSGSNVIQFLGDKDWEVQSIQDEISELAERLERLPRVTRVTFGLMLQRREIKIENKLIVDIAIFERVANYRDVHIEARLLDKAGLLSFDPPDDTYAHGSFILGCSKYCENFLIPLVKFSESKGIELTQVFSSLDFSQF